MNYRQLQYAVLLSEARSFSQVAEDLDISQPALSKQILSLEAELGVKLFDRSTTPLSLTPAGEYFVQKAQSLLFEEDVLIKTMERFRTNAHGSLTIGISPFRSLYMMPPVVKMLKERFPGLQITLVENNRSQRQKEVLEGQYDFAIMNLPVDESRLDVIPLEQDRLVLAVPNSLCPLIGRTAGDPGTVPVDMADCTALPFVVVERSLEMRQLFDRLCTMAQLDPDIRVEVVGITSAWTMVHSGVGAALVPMQFARQQGLDNTVTLFPLTQTTYVRQPVIVTRRGQFVSQYAQAAIDLLKQQNPA